jgi:hypothetical protein
MAELGRKSCVVVVPWQIIEQVRTDRVAHDISDKRITPIGAKWTKNIPNEPNEFMSRRPNFQMITHNRPYFYKYTSATTAASILRNRRLRWSSPFSFNDPFDTQFDLRFEFENQDYVEAFLEKFWELLSSGAPIPNSGDPFRAMLFESFRQLRLPKEEVFRELRPALLEGAGNAKASLPEANLTWRRSIADDVILCVSETRDNLLMWSHYADHHKGVVLQLKCLPELDTALCAASAVKYSDTMPSLASRDLWIETLLGLRSIDLKQATAEFMYTKSLDWAYEKEWRCVAKRRDLNNRGYEDFLIFPAEITAIYFGCRIAAEHRAELLALLQPDFRHVSLLRAAKHPLKFALEFSPYEQGET